MLDESFSLGEFRVQLLGWERARRFVVVRKLLHEGRNSVGRKLLDVPGYTFRLFVTSRSDAPEGIWRDYNRRADMENRIAELKDADGFCLQEFFATEAAFNAVLLRFNLVSEFQRAAGLPIYREPATLRTQVFAGGAILGRAGRRRVLHRSKSWGGLKTRNPLLDQNLKLGNSNFAEVGICRSYLSRGHCFNSVPKYPETRNLAPQLRISGLVVSGWGGISGRFFVENYGVGTARRRMVAAIGSSRSAQDDSRK